MSREPPAIYTFDFETDPFKFDRQPLAFAVGVYCLSTKTYEHCWGRGNTPQEVQRDCVDFLLDVMDAAPRGSLFFAHNGGKFDFHYFKEHIRGAMKVIGARIAQCRVGHVICRDSFAMLPVALSKFGGKVDIDYEKMERDVRDRYREEILHYMKEDCLVLARAIERFIGEFGLHLTMAGAAMKQMQKFHDFDRLAKKKTDDDIRPYYFGGRVECIESGVLEGPWKLYDVNAMYPSVMRNFEHPASEDMIEYIGKYAETLGIRADFLEIDAVNLGCLPMVGEDGKLSFRRERGTFFATGHEVRAGLETGTLIVKRIHRAWKATQHSNFAAFVDHFQAKRYEAKEAGDALLDLFYKLVLNSSYGKLAQNPSAYRDWIVSDEIFNTDDGYMLHHTFPDGVWKIWSCPSQTPEHLMRFNVATAASITGAARAQLWRGLCQAERPIYCDTDSMMCRDYRGEIDAKRLGAWKLEAEAARVAIAGRKLYAMFDGGGRAIKQASKGVRVNASDIAAVASENYPEFDKKGGYVMTKNEAPTFSLNKAPHFISRKVRKTV